MLKYQLVTKLILGSLVMPVFALASALLTAHAGAVTNANLIPFLLSPRGIVFALLLCILITAGILLELAGFITISARYWAGEPEASFRSILRHNLGRVDNFLGPGLLLMLAYLVVAIPLTGVGSGLSFLGVVKIPTFITAVIEGTPSYAIAYALLLAVLAIGSILASYTFHRVILADETIGRAMWRSVRWVLKHPKVHLSRVVAPTAVGLLVVVAAVAGWIVLIVWLLDAYGAESTAMKGVLIGLLLVQQLVFTVAAFLVVPLEIHLLTGAYLTVESADVARLVPDLAAKTRRTWPDRIVHHPVRSGAVVLVVIALLSWAGAVFFDPIFRRADPVVVVGHRAGGFAAPENSFAGLEVAIEQGATMVEIDIQRTSDGHYVLNHDATFARAAGDNRASTDMTLAEVKQLDISSARDGSEWVPELGEFLESARGRTKVLVELKGRTADERMVDDVVALVDRMGMADEVVLISLDYRLITYIEQAHARIDSGYLYFFSVGNVTALTADYVLLEEGEATPERVESLSFAGKRPIVWTVNTEPDMERVLVLPVYGIITDRIDLLTHEIATRDEASAADILRRALLGVQ